MGSRMMHLIIADSVATELEVTDRGSIFLGAVAPDAAKDWYLGHFKAEANDYPPGSTYEWGQFVNKYRSLLPAPYLIGYLTHLVADEVWGTRSHYTGLTARLLVDDTLHQRYQNDFRLCNAKLHAFIGNDRIYTALSAANRVIDLEEVEGNSVLELKQDALEDFHYPVEHLQEPLDVFTFEEILEYIERSTRRAIDVYRVAGL